MASKGEVTELKAGIHIDIVQASVRGVKISAGKLEILGLTCAFEDFHGDMQAIEDLGAEGFVATITMEGKIVREIVPDKPKGGQAEGQEPLPFSDEEHD
jgi:hypothetical protein